MFALMKSTRAIVAVAAIVLCTACSLNTGIDGPQQIIHKGSTLSLAWDEPELPVGSLEIVTYNLYYRSRGLTEWKNAGSVEASDSPGVSLSVEDIGYGVWEFAVSSVDSDGEESDLHASIDRSAEPFTGWYVFWIGSE